MSKQEVFPGGEDQEPISLRRTVNPALRASIENDFMSHRGLKPEDLYEFYGKEVVDAVFDSPYTADIADPDPRTLEGFDNAA